MGRHKEYRTLHSLQAEFEKTIYGERSKKMYAQCLTAMVDYFDGRTRRPEDVFRFEIPALREYLMKSRGIAESTVYYYMRVGSSFYSWMDLHEYVPPDYNPFRQYTKYKKRPTD